MIKQILYIFIAITVFGCKSSSVVYNDPVPKHDSLKISSDFVKEDRVINIWTPPGYAESQERYPVLYMPDGGIKEDFPHIANTVAALVKEGKIPAVILVGIENTVRGRDLTGESQVKEHEKYKIPMTDGAKNFRSFIKKELMTEINSRYRTSDTKGIIGESLAGLFVMETFFLEPASFDFYIAMDPSLWWNGNHLVNNAEKLLNNLPQGSTKLWFAGSDTPDIAQYTRQLEKILKNRNIANLTWKYVDKPDEKHSTIFRATKEEALIWALN